ncbi:hypothetical protein Aph01nite_06120 [Acrocarpospora phusangensis]|uniref:Uncharacterized protein n=1 Tax=Acrocarpospora phusangensis TaxID=1070424 RepID=A0A919Q9H4_9ACTN|nr:hypothetical protein Aph01nite_06120 [Acrocarpospora phusangensis]
MAFQKSAYSTAALLSFTINLSVVSKELWEQQRPGRWLPERPAPSTFYGQWVWQRRIGQLIPGGSDHWWDVGTTLDRAVVSDLLDGLRNYAFPAMMRELGRN